MLNWFKKYESIILILLIFWLCFKSCVLNNKINDLSDNIDKKFNKSDSIGSVIINKQINIKDIKSLNDSIILSYLKIKDVNNKKQDVNVYVLPNKNK